jgi:hypothetical protein
MGDRRGASARGEDVRATGLSSTFGASPERQVTRPGVFQCVHAVAYTTGAPITAVATV